MITVNDLGYLRAPEPEDLQWLYGVENDAIAVESTSIRSRCTQIEVNKCMLIREVIEAKASAELCKSSKPNDALSASDLSSCKSQGLRARETKRKYKIGGQTQGISGKKVRGKKYGGNLPAHGKKNQDNARKGKAEG